MKLIAFIACLLLVACGKKEQPTSAAAPPAPEKKAPPPVPQGKLPAMDPEKAKFIAVPSTPKDLEPKKVEKPATEVKK